MTVKQDARVEKALEMVKGVLGAALPGAAGELVEDLGTKVVDTVLEAFGIDTGSVFITAPARVKVSIKSRRRRR